MSHITFFRDRRQSEGESYAFDLRAPKRSARLYIFSRKPLDAKLVESREERDVDKAIEGTAQMVREAGGGIVIALRDSEGKMKVVMRPGEPEASFERVGVLRPGYPLTFENLNGKWQDLPRGSQVLVPIDPQAERVLQGFKEHIEWLPADMESMVWTALRRPSMDARLERLETRIFGKPATDEQTKAGLLWKEWFRKPAVLWGSVALLLALLLGLGGYRTYRFLSDRRADPEPAQKEEQGKERPAERKTDTAIPEVARRIDRIFLSIKEKKRSALALTQLANAHRDEIEDMNAQDIEELFARGPSEDLDRVLLALIKLQVLKLDEGAPSTEFLDEPFGLNPTKAALARVDPQVLDNDSAARDLLASLSCQLRSASPESAPLLLETRGSCRDYPLKKALPGLEALPRFIGEYTRADPTSTADGN